jgi:hypothetical protein
MDMKQLIERLEAEWGSDGFLGQLRLGKFTSEGAARFLLLLREIDIDEQVAVPKRALSLLWYLPSFLAWQRERVEEKGGDMNVYAHFLTDVLNTLEDVLGVP